METQVSKAELKAGFDTIRAVADAVRELGTVPSGNIYAVCMGHVSAERFDKILNTLVNANLIERQPSGLLRWIGPAKEVS